jgi:hypothetical protein
MRFGQADHHYLCPISETIISGRLLFRPMFAHAKVGWARVVSSVYALYLGQENHSEDSGDDYFPSFVAAWRTA